MDAGCSWFAWDANGGDRVDLSLLVRELAFKVGQRLLLLKRREQSGKLLQKS